jgi:hypothetical protein
MPPKNSTATISEAQPAVLSGKLSGDERRYKITAIPTRTPSNEKAKPKTVTNRSGLTENENAIRIHMRIDSHNV